MSTFAMYTEPACGVSDVVVRREKDKRLIVTTSEPLNDDQMRDIYWITLAMVRTGKNLKELMEGIKA